MELLVASRLTQNLETLQGGDIPKELADKDPMLFMRKVKYHKLLKMMHS